MPRWKSKEIGRAEALSHSVTITDQIRLSAVHCTGAAPGPFVAVPVLVMSGFALR